MKKFLVLYMIPTNAMDEWKTMPAEERSAAESKMTREIQAWTGGRAKLFTDPGAGLGKAKRVTSGGVSNARNDLVMYAIVQGESPDAVAQTLANHPHLQIPQSSIDVMELFAMPDQPRK
jgi:hypothetical protein